MQHPREQPATNEAFGGTRSWDSAQASVSSLLGGMQVLLYWCIRSLCIQELLKVSSIPSLGVRCSELCRPFEDFLGLSKNTISPQSIVLYRYIDTSTRCRPRPLLILTTSKEISCKHDTSISEGSMLSYGRVGLPKKGEDFFFFRIKEDRVEDFCTNLLDLIPLITTAAQCQDDLARIAREKARAKKHHITPDILEMSGINIAFSQKGLKQVSSLPSYRIPISNC